MKTNKLSFLWCIPVISGLLFSFLSCTRPAESPKASLLQDSLQNQQRDNTRTVNIIFRSADNGQTWENISQGLPEPVKDDYGFGSNVFFADGNGLWLANANGIYHTKPGFTTTTWTKEFFPAEHNSIAPGKTGIYAYNYGGGGILKKTNGTGIWSPVFTNFPEKRVFSFFETAGGTIFIGSDRGLFKSSNKGNTWKQLPVGGGGKMVESNGVLLTTCEQGIVRSTDDGENWTMVISEGGVGIDVARIEGGFAAITYSTISKTRRIRTSYDGGNSWQAIDAGLQLNGFNDPILSPVNAKLPVKGFSDSTRNAEDTANLPVQTYITTIVQVGENFFCGRSDGIYRSTDKGKTWQCMRCVEEGKMFRLFVSGNVVYAIQVEAHC